MVGTTKSSEPAGIHRRSKFEITPSLIARFNDKVGARPEGGCWLWVGAPRNGYGAIRHEKKVLSAHIVSYVMHKGPIPPGAIITHDCDVRLCVNPDHLRLGTPGSNVREMYDRRLVHIVRGEAHYNAKLTTEQVHLMRALHLVRGMGRDRIGKLMGVAEGTIQSILSGKRWGHIPLQTADEMAAMLLERNL